jgi:glycosyltransferase involved in cell wall biosynthesis
VTNFPRPRILLVANSGWNIAKFRTGLIRSLAENGYDVVVACPNDTDLKSDRSALAVRVETVNIHRSGLDPLSDLKVIFDFVRLIRRERPAAILTFTVKPNIYGCIAARLTGATAIPNVSGLGTSFLASPVLKKAVEFMYRIAFRKVERVFFQNADDCRYFLTRRIISESQARLVPGSGIDLKRFSPVPLPDGELRFLLIGRLLGDKGVREYVEAARMLRNKLPDAKFLLLGPLDTSNRTAIKRAELDRWISEGAIEYLGEAEDVRPLIREAHAVVLPSYREGMPRSLLEAAAMARPMIGTDVPGCRNIIRDRVTGLLCEARNSSSLADALERFAAMSHEERTTMAAAARAMVEEAFDEQIVFEAYLRALQSIGPARRTRVSTCAA